MAVFLFVGPPGLEPGTHSLKGCRSNRLSYGPTLLLFRELEYFISKTTIIKVASETFALMHSQASVTFTVGKESSTKFSQEIHLKLTPKL